MGLLTKALGEIGRILKGGLIRFCVGWLAFTVFVVLSNYGNVSEAFWIAVWVGFFAGGVPGFTIGAAICDLTAGCPPPHGD